MLGFVSTLACPLLAHAVFAGAGDFVNGLFHALSSLPNLLLLVALGLTLAQPTPLRLREPILSFLAGVIVGALGSLLRPGLSITPAVLSALTFITALSVVGWIPLNLITRSGLAGLAALVLGVGFHWEFQEPLSTVQDLAGATLGLALALTSVAFYASLRPARPWADIGLRILAAWIAAISLLSFAFAFRK